MAVWFQKWRMWFKSASIDPTDKHRLQLANIVTQHSDKGCQSELKVNNIGLNSPLELIELVVTNRLKLTCPAIERMTSLFNLPPHKEHKSHTELLKPVEIAVTSGGVGTRVEFHLTYDQMIVRLTILLFP